MWVSRASLKQFRSAERVLPDEARRMKVVCNAIHRGKVEYLGYIELAPNQRNWSMGPPRDALSIGEHSVVDPTSASRESFDGQ